MTIKEFLTKLQEVSNALSVEITSPLEYQVNYNSYEFISINFKGNFPKFDFEYTLGGFEAWEADTVIGAIKVVKEFMKSNED